LAIQVFERIQYLHLFGILIGDLRMNNIMISPNGEPTIVDLDSCQIDNLPCPAGFGDFTPAELQKVEFSKQLRTYDNESFSCAVLMFKILFCGLHPYDQRNGADTIEEEIALKSFPYPLSVDASFDKIVYGCYDEIWKNTPYQFQQFLYDIFKNGARPNIQTMIMMLKTYDEFIEINKLKNSKINEISFQEE
jgi:DNA-binding helix-hairpin-helix protein with protein kinase domain